MEREKGRISVIFLERTSCKSCATTTTGELSRAIIFHSRVAARRISAGALLSAKQAADARGREKEKGKEEIKKTRLADKSRRRDAAVDAPFPVPILSAKRAQHLSRCQYTIALPTRKAGR